MAFSYVQPHCTYSNEAENGGSPTVFTLPVPLSSTKVPAVPFDAKNPVVVFFLPVSSAWLALSQVTKPSVSLFAVDATTTSLPLAQSTNQPPVALPPTFPKYPSRRHSLLLLFDTLRLGLPILSPSCPTPTTLNLILLNSNLPCLFHRRSLPSTL